MVTAEAQLIRRILDGGLPRLLEIGFDPSIMSFPFNEAAGRILDYYRRHKEVPSIGRFQGICIDLGIPVLDSSQAPSAVTVYWDQVVEAHRKASIKNSLDAIAEAYNEKKMTDDQFLDFSTRELMSVNSRFSAFTGGPIAMAGMAGELREDYRMRASGSFPGIPVPDEFVYLKKSLVRLEPAQITTIVSRRSVGKTWKGLMLALCAARHEFTVLIASKEMARIDLTRRLVALATGLDFDLVKKGELLGENLNTFNRYLDDMENGKGLWNFIHIMEPREIKNVMAVENRAKGLEADMVFADAFYMWPGPQPVRWQRIEANLSDVRDVSLDTGRHWVLTAQFNKEARDMYTSNEFAIGGSDSFNQDSNNIIHLVQRKVDKKNRMVIFELSKGRDCDALTPWLHYWNFHLMKYTPIAIYQGKTPKMDSSASK